MTLRLLETDSMPIRRAKLLLLVPHTVVYTALTLIAVCVARGPRVMLIAARVAWRMQRIYVPLLWMGLPLDYAAQELKSQLGMGSVQRAS